MNRFAIDTPFAFEGRPVSCNLCGSNNHELIATKGRHGEKLHTVICRDCGLVFTNPMPTSDEIRYFYKNHYRKLYKGVYGPKLKHVYRSGKRSILRYHRLKGFLRKGMRLLDVGSGGGEFVYLIKSLDLDAYGLEPNEGFAKYSIDEYDIPVIQGFIETAELKPASFDVITAHHIIEHLLDPSLAFDVFHPWLKGGGRLVVEVPNVEATYHSPRNKFHLAHLYNFSQACLETMGRKSEFEVHSTILIPDTLHINTIFIKADGKSVKVKQPDNYRRIKASLSRHTGLAHALSRYPYLRTVGNVLRPIRETIALRNCGTARQLLDDIYRPLRAQAHAD